MKTHGLHILLSLVLILLPGRILALSATSFFPVNGGSGVCVDSPLKITFDSVPALGNSGAIRIINSAGQVV